jgi:hypothetical protein
MPAKIINVDQTPTAYLDDKKAPRLTLNNGFSHDTENDNIDLNLGTGLDFDGDGKVVSNAVHGKLLRDIEAYMSFDSAIQDDIGRHSLTNNGATRGDATGIVGGGVTFNDTAGNNIDLGGSLDSTGDFTWALWVKPSADAKMDILRLAPEDSTDSKGIILRYEGSGVGFKLYAFNDGNTSTDTSPAVATVTKNGSPSTPSGEWYFLRVVRKGTGVNNTSLYLETESTSDIQQKQDLEITTGSRGSTVSQIGENESGPSNTGNGFTTPPSALNAVVDEVGVWNRALKDSEMSVLHDAGLGSNEFLEFDQQWWDRPAQGDVNLKSNRITNLASASNGTDAVNKNDLDAQAGTVQQLLRDIRLYYTFDGGNSNDYFRGYDGTDTNMNYPAGTSKIGTAAEFQTGSDSKFTNGNAFNFRDNDFTLSFWIQPNSGGTTRDETILTSDRADGNNKFEVNYMASTSGGSLQIVMHGSSEAADQESHTTNTTLQTDQWQHVVIQRDGSNLTAWITVDTNPSINKDSTVQDSAVPSGDLSVAGASQVGQGSQAAFQGYIDEFGVWDRPLTTDEITQLFGSGNGKQSFLDFSQSIQRSASVEFVAASDASAVERHVASFLCDGTDDDVEINTAIGNGDKTIQLSSGTFNLSAMIDVNKDNLTIRGQGRYNTILKGNSSSIVETANQTSGGFSMQDLTVDGNRNGTTTSDAAKSCVQLGTAKQALRNVSVVNSLGSGIQCLGVEDVTIDNCTVDNCNDNGIEVSESTKRGVTIANCYTTECAQGSASNKAGYSLSGIVTLNGCQDLHSVISVFLQGSDSSNHVVLSGCYAVSSGGSEVVKRQDFGGRLSMNGCQFETPDTSLNYVVDLQDTSGSNYCESITLTGLTVLGADTVTALRVGHAKSISISGGSFDQAAADTTTAVELVDDGTTKVQALMTGAHLEYTLDVNGMSKAETNAIITGCFLGNGVNDTNNLTTLTGNVDGSA